MQKSPLHPSTLLTHYLLYHYVNVKPLSISNHVTIISLFKLFFLLFYTHRGDSFSIFSVLTVLTWSNIMNIATYIMYLIIQLDNTEKKTHFLTISAQEQNFGDQFLHVILQDGSPVAKLGCGGSRVLNAAAGQSINNNRWTTITIRYDMFLLLLPLFLKSLLLS